MLLIAKTPRGEGAIQGWCPDKTGTPQAIIVTTEGKLIYASIRDVELVGFPKRIAKQAIRVHKREQKKNMKLLVNIAKSQNLSTEVQ